MLALCVLLSLEAAPPGLPVVEAVPAVVTTMHNYLSIEGTVRSPLRRELVPRLGGQIAKVAHPDGGEVKRGDTLFQLDDRALRIELAKAEAVLKRAEARLALDTTTLGRIQKLIKARVGGSDEDLSRAETAVRVGQADAEAARADVDLARLRLDSARITAPFDGRVSRSRVSEGAIVKGDETILAVAEGGEPQAVFDVEESDFQWLFRKIREGKHAAGKAAFEVDLRLDGKAAGMIVHIDEALDSTTKKGQVRISLPKGTSAAPGSFVQAYVKRGAAYRAAIQPQAAYNGFRAVSSTGPRRNDVVPVVDSSGRIALREVVRQSPVSVLIFKGLEPGDRFLIYRGPPRRARLESGLQVIVVAPTSDPE